MRTLVKLRRALAAACVAAGLGLGGCQDSNEGALSVVVSLPEHYPAGAVGAVKATIEVDYSATGARILSEGGGAACAFILPGIDGDFVDDRKGTLTIKTNGSRALRGPSDIAACLMKASDADTTAAEVHDKLLVKVAAAEDAAGKPVDIAVKGPKGNGGGGGGMSERDIEQAQEAAVKAAASAVPPPVANPAGAQDGSGPVPGAALKTPQATAAAAASVAAAAAQKQAATAKAAPPANIPNPASAGRGADAPAPPANNEGVPTDRDPSYDDSLADDKSAPSYTLEFYVTSASRFGALQLEITHLGSAGGFIGRGAEVECVPLVDALVASNYPGERVTKIGIISLAGVDTPRAVMRCGFRTREPLSANSFRIEVADAADTDTEPLEPFPTVVISTITPR